MSTYIVPLKKSGERYNIAKSMAFDGMQVSKLKRLAAQEAQWMVYGHTYLMQKATAASVQKVRKGLQR